jgi:hypothetical protein
MPIAYYPTFLRYNPQAAIDSNFLHFWWNTLTIGPWPSGSAWFLWVLLALNAIAALLWAAAPRLIETFGQLIATLRERPMTAFTAFLTLTVIIYLPMRVMFGDTSWLVPGHYPLPIQTSRILLYAGYFLTGVGVGAVNLKTGMLAENGALAKRWVVWLAFAFVFYGAILLLVYAHHNWLEDFNSPPLWWHTAYGLAFAALCLWHLSRAFRFPDLAAIHRLRSTLPGLRQIRHRVHRHAVDELGANAVVTKDSRRSANDLAQNAFWVAPAVHAGTGAHGHPISTTHPDPGTIVNRKPCNFTIAATRLRPRPRPVVCLIRSDR